jgi:hypothetical protein
MSDTTIVDPHVKPARKVLDARCPRCGVECPEGDKTKRVPSGGFGGGVHDVCRRCGHEFEGLTV